MRKALLVLLCMVLALTALVACGHTHTFEEDWSTDAENHWHDATCEHTEEKDSLGAHVDDDEDFVCDTCGHDRYFFVEGMSFVLYYSHQQRDKKHDDGLHAVKAAFRFQHIFK